MNGLSRTDHGIMDVQERRRVVEVVIANTVKLFTVKIMKLI